MKIVLKSTVNEWKVTTFFNKHWGSPMMVVSSGVYDCRQLEGYVALNANEEIIGMITFLFNNKKCEIISLDSIDEGKGIGTTLINNVENMAKINNCHSLKVITTNDNLQALRFYQKRGFRISHIHINAVEEARKIKAAIPQVGDHGIPIRDEIELEKVL